MGFKVGQKVVLREMGEIDMDDWGGFMPKVGEIYIIESFHKFPQGIYLKFKESEEDVFHEYYFEPLILDYDFVEEVIKQVTPKEQEA